MFPSSSQPYEEAGKKVNSIALFTKISTHSLTKRLTVCCSYSSGSRIYFNSQPHEEADHILTTLNVETILHFNSQPHEEADWNSYQIVLIQNYFNSQPHEEADVGTAFSGLADMVFQLTASRRG